MENTVCIYGLVDPRTDEIRYVGKTVNPVARLDKHMSSGKGSRAKNRWLTNLYQSMNVPKMVVLDWVPQGQADDYERAWIRVLLEDGLPMTNSSLNPTGIRAVPAGNNRPAKKTGRVYQYMDQIVETENRVPSFSEVQQTLNLPKSTASKIRLQWLEEHGYGKVEE